MSQPERKPSVLRLYTDPLVRPTKCILSSWVPLERRDEVIADMKFWLELTDGIGFAAPQIGVPLQIFTIRRGDTIVTCLDPVVIDESEEMVRGREGCLSIPQSAVYIDRHKTITIAYADPTGLRQVETFEGLEARVVQHELDHLKGILITDKCGPVARDLMLRKARNFINKSGLQNALSSYRRIS